MKLNKLRPEHVQQLYNQLHARGLATSTIKSAHVPLSQSLDKAVSLRYIYINPCKDAVIPSKPPKEARAMTRTEQDIFEKACKNSTYHNLFMFYLYTGLRCNEALALTWEDVDNEKNIIKISKIISRVKNRDEDRQTSNKYVISSPKTPSGYREVPLNNVAKKILERQASEALFIFPSTKNTALKERNVARGLSQLLEKVNLPSDITLHSLRHTFATRMLEEGADMKIVSAILGHKNIKITYDLYAHALPDHKQETIRLLDKRNNIFNEGATD